VSERKTFGQQLREARIAARLSQTNLARKARIKSVHLINKYENDTSRLRLATIKKLEKALDCKFDIIQADIFGDGAKLEPRAVLYSGLREKIKSLGPDEVLQFPGHAAIAQRIRIALRRDREINQNLPQVRVTHKVKEGIVCISPKAITMPWEGDKLEIKKVSRLPINTPSLKGIKSDKYSDLINRINSMDDGEVITIKSDDVERALALRSRVQEYKNQGRFKGSFEIIRRKETIYVAKEKQP